MGSVLREGRVVGSVRVRATESLRPGCLGVSGERAAPVGGDDHGVLDAHAAVPGRYTPGSTVTT